MAYNVLGVLPRCFARCAAGAYRKNRLTCPFLKQDDLYGQQQYQNVQEKTAMFDVIQIIRQLAARVVNRSTVRVIHLRPTRDTWFDAAALAIARHLPGELFYEIGPFRTRTDKAHRATQHIDQLRQLIDPGQSDKGADAGNARVAKSGPDWSMH